MISQVLFTSEQPKKNQNGFRRYIFTDKVNLLVASYSACVVHTKTIIQLSVGESFEQINSSHHLARKYARIFVRGHNLFREENSFQRAKLEENCELRGTDNVQGQISEHIFAPNGDYCLYYPSNLFRNARSFEN